jgi:hypothetical protein
MNYTALQQELLLLLMDQSPGILAAVPDYINESIQQIAEDVKFPELKQVCSVTTDISTYFVNMPANFSSRLLYAGDSNYEYKVLDGGIEELIKLYPSLAESGDIQHLTLEGNILYYHPIPTVAKVITCIGYCKPALLVNGTDTPSFIPDYLHRDAIVNKAAVFAYSIIEDGIEGGMVNTKVLSGLAENGINKLRAYVSRRRSVISKSMWSC